MSKRSDHRSWAQLLVGALIGAFLTGIIQYSLNEQSREHEEERMRTQVVKSYLEDKLQTRQGAYAQIRRKVVEALRNPSPESTQAALVSLRADLPFIQPLRPTQQGIAYTSGELILLFLESDGSDAQLTVNSLLDQLERDMQADISSIENELLKVSDVAQQ